MTTRADIVAEAREWIGTRWQHQAMLKGVACDCIGLAGGVALACGVDEARAWAVDPDFKGYGRDPDPKKLIAACEKYLDRIPVWRATAGDILVFCIGTEEEPRHFALVSSVDPMRIIHAHAPSRRVVENILNDDLRRQVVAAYTFRGLR